MTRLTILLVLTVATATQAFWGGDDNKYIKKFAMMKVYESCFGDEVVREVRDEMRAAAARCAGAVTIIHPPGTNVNPQQHAQPGQDPLSAMTLKPQRPSQPEAIRKPPASTPNLSAESLLRLQTLLQGLRTQGNANLAAAFPASQQQQQQQTQQQQQQQQHYRPGGYPGFSDMHGPPAPAAYPPARPGYGGYSAPPPTPFYYPPPPMPYYPPYNPYASPYMQRSSRDMRGGPGRVRNVTCVMQELGYLDSNLEPNYAGIIARIERLPLPVELRNDMTDAVNFCQKFAQCIPEPDQDKIQVSTEFTKPMLFFRCYKQKKLEACVLKDVRERFMSQSPSGSNDDLPDHNGLDDDDNEAAGALRGGFRGRSGRLMSTSRASTELADLLLSDLAL